MINENGDVGALISHPRDPSYCVLGPVHTGEGLRSGLVLGKPRDGALLPERRL